MDMMKNQVSFLGHLMDMGELAGHRMKIEIFNDHVMCLPGLEYKGGRV